MNKTMNQTGSQSKEHKTLVRLINLCLFLPFIDAMQYNAQPNDNVWVESFSFIISLMMHLNLGSRVT